MAISNKSWLITLSVLGITYITVVCSSAYGASNSSNDKGYEVSKAASSLCVEDWFPHSQTPAPQEGQDSLFNVMPTTNAIFHQWSWQKFLWLTKPDRNGKPIFEVETKQVDSNMSLVGDSSRLILSSYRQADDGVLRSNPEYSSLSKSYTVYYSIHVNDTMLDASKNYADTILTPPIKDHNLYTFPVGSLELKASWVNVNAIPSNLRHQYFTRNAKIDSDLFNGEVEVALLGMHVTGVVENHPEFIWATFEHVNLAPKFEWSYPDEGNSYLHPVSSNTPLLFYKKGVYANKNDILKPKDDTEMPQKNVFTLYEYGVPKWTLGTPGTRGYFTKTSQDHDQTPQKRSENYDNIAELNSCVHEGLAKEDVWRNYFYNGSIWIDTDNLTQQEIAQKLVSLGSQSINETNGLANAEYGSSTRGSVALSNITMETYFQFKNGDDINLKAVPVKNMRNCFTCHGTDANFGSEGIKLSSPLNFSHIFRRYLSERAGVMGEELDQLRHLDLQLAK
ncbi:MULTISPECIES: hypothetical protein [Vibrio]|uniref:hypothetical protein n=1 Tax=Vibrio TaxID=662 RepID=UPI0014828385|nr:MULTISPECIES: hypothetical protein [Vibrio]EJL6630980.1 hypothetical protein [Vibrio cholerae]MBT2948367.1 hypothetical protein [Vibrio anguillarum]MDQ2166380.1 hypothetical protein [Vibrio anguillarum]NNN97784.1 hypothetical protein [Vibrio sp. B4-6]